eukprot:CAMPEP_0202728184 /NCGR_PEP_ID=MMETSP1385-20130828/185499_1 /ASSEMBLY_ACC=CAM_ASM_000861 /TAXON_ID=933848 /ORGANISM="Elphidium margaritaceum" /LENGTH=577 /DNA_ID=CAMNT_0049394431 /DNA_START=103 /DNA_END=1836 /DNA_ORIENTATION=+
MSNIKIDAFCPVGIGGTKGVDTSKLKLFVGGLPADLTSKDLFDIFSSFGTIREAVVIPDRFRVRSRCYGFLTFVNAQSVSNVLSHRPICTRQGIQLTVVLASANSKPRRAHFNVKHGISGHKPLPKVAEEEELNQSSQPIKSSDRKHGNYQGGKGGKVSIYTDPSLFRTANIQSIAPATLEVAEKHQPKVAEEDEFELNQPIKSSTRSSDRHGNYQCGKGGKVSIYTDPSLFRTANIQSIAPATLEVAEKPQLQNFTIKASSVSSVAESDTESVVRKSWPNDDIKSDFRRLSKVTAAASTDPNQSETENNDKAWKLIGVESEIDTTSVYSVDTLYYDCNDADFYTTRSQKWKPIKMCSAEKSKTTSSASANENSWSHSPLNLTHAQNEALQRSTTSTVFTENVQCMVGSAMVMDNNQSNVGVQQTSYKPAMTPYSDAQSNKSANENSWSHSPLNLTHAQNEALQRSTTSTVSTENVQCMVGSAMVMDNQSNVGVQQTSYKPAMTPYSDAQSNNVGYLQNAFAYCLSDCQSNHSNVGSNMQIDPSASNYSLLSVPLNASVFCSIPLAYSQSNFRYNNQ